MATSNHHGKSLTIVFLLFAAVIGGVGYYSFNTTLNEESESVSAKPVEESAAPTADPSEEAKEKAVLSVTGELMDDIVIGKADAPVTIIDYSSLSCPHCAHFHNDVLPKLKKELLDTGKAKLVFRHFPLNEPALRAAQLVNCADATQRVAFLSVLFEKQGDWAFTEDFLKQLKPLAALGGVDSAAFDSCMADASGEARILEVRKAAAEAGHVNSTPSFVINGVLMQGTPTIENFREAIGK